jgi:hypothetical protein
MVKPKFIPLAAILSGALLTPLAGSDPAVAPAASIPRWTFEAGG